MFQAGNSSDPLFPGGGAEVIRLPHHLIDPNAEGLSVGQRLRAARTARSLQVEDIAPMHVPLPVAILKALEAEDTDKLPPFAITQGMLRSYAAHLGLDPNAMVTQWRAEVQRAEELPQPDVQRKSVISVLSGVGFVAALAALGAVAYFGGKAVVDMSRGEAPVIAGNSSTTPVIEALNGNAPSAREVKITAVRMAWLEARGPDGAIYLSRVLTAGEVYQPEVGAGWTLHARDAGAFRVTVDGVESGLLGENGAPAIAKRVDLLAAPVDQVETPVSQRPA
jgi:cytoskeleton protein RodZ